MYKMGVYPSKLTRAGYCQKICIMILSTYQVVDTILQGCHGEGKMKIFPGHEKVREICGWPGKFRKDWESQRKVGEFENKWLWQAVFRQFIYSVEEGKGCTFS